MYASLSSCMTVCMSVCVSVYACLSCYVSTCVPVYMSVWLHARVPVRLHVSLSFCLCVFLHLCLPACLCFCMPVCCLSTRQSFYLCLSIPLRLSSPTLYLSLAETNSAKTRDFSLSPSPPVSFSFSGSASGPRQGETIFSADQTSVVNSQALLEGDCRSLIPNANKLLLVPFLVISRSGSDIKVWRPLLTTRSRARRNDGMKGVREGRGIKSGRCERIGDRDTILPEEREVENDRAREER